MNLNNLAIQIERFNQQKYMSGIKNGSCNDCKAKHG